MLPLFKGGFFMQDFLTSTLGQIIVVVSIIVLLIVIFKTSKKDNKNNVKALTYSAIAIAIAFVLNAFIVFKMPQGGSATLFSMLVIVLIAYWFGPKNGILAGLAFGLLNAMYQPFIVHPMQFLLDYPLAFGMLGVAGFFRNKKHGLQWGYIVAVLGRYVCHVMSGIIFFAEYAGDSNVILYSIIYNASYIGIEAIITFALLWVPGVRNAFSRIKTNLN